ncbi:MAG: transcriptional regulator GcvA [Sulfuricella sp.]|nr:transcriptional regulator GcvA [Sulfuricella sp.]
MTKAMPPLSALRAFEAAARHLSFTRAALELNVTPGALSHQIRGLEEFLGLRLFERRARAIELTAQGKMLYPGLQAGFGLIRDAVVGLRAAQDDDRVLVLSTSPGLTAKWLAARLYRFAEACPDIDLRVSSSVAYANLATDGIDAAIRSIPHLRAEDPALIYEKLMDVAFVPVCSPKLIARFGPLDAPGVLPQVPLIHDDMLADHADVPTWADWLRVAGLVGGDVGRGLRFNSADHALDAALEGAGLLLTHGILAHDDLRCGRLVIPFDLVLPSERAYYFVCPRGKEQQRKLRVFREWLQDEVSRLDKEG